MTRNQRTLTLGTKWGRTHVYIFGAVLGLLLGVYGWIVIKHSAGDFGSMYLASGKLMNASDIYWSPPESDPQRQCSSERVREQIDQIKNLAADVVLSQKICIHPNLNPPFFILIAAPLARLGFEAAWLTWFAISLACLSATTLLIWREKILAATAFPLALQLAGLMLYPPTVIDLIMGQVTFEVMLPMVLGWVALRRKENQAAGAWLGLAASLKPFVALFLIGLVFQKNMRAAAVMLITGLVLTLCGMLAGAGAYQSYSDALQSINWHSASWNASFFGFFSRPFGGSQNMPWLDAPWLARGLAQWASLIVLAVYVRSMWRLREQDASLKADGLMILSVPNMLLISPLGWIYYFPMLLIGVPAMWRSSMTLANSVRYRWALGLSLLLTAVPSELMLAKDINDPFDWLAVSGIYTVALVQMFTLGVLCMDRRPHHLSLGGKLPSCG